MPVLNDKRKKEKYEYFYEMIIDKEKREKMFEYFDSKYEETETDKEILKSMTKRRKS